MILEEIQSKVALGEFEFTEHAVERSIRRGISVQELREAIADAQIIEEYEDDKYGPSYLLFGLTHKGRPIHVQCGDPSRDRMKVITLYEPSPWEWVDFRVRRS